MPLKFRNVRLGFEAPVSYRNTWEKQRKGGKKENEDEAPLYL